VASRQGKEAGPGDEVWGPMIKPDEHCLLLAVPFLLASLVASGCGLAVVATTPSATPASVDVLPPPPTSSLPQTPLPIHAPAASPSPAVPDTGWERLRPGLERRVINVTGDTGEPFERLFLLRLEPEDFRFDVAYHPEPRTLEEWQAETNALIVLNGGYFRGEEGAYLPNGLTVVDGRAIGTSYGEFAGMLAVTRDGPELRWLTLEPYDPNEPLLAALQSFPVLVKPGGVMGFPEQEEDHRAARRSVIAEDRDGRVLFVVASRGNFTLHRLSAYLVASDLDLYIAVNLDGGPSSGVLLASPLDQVPALVPLPVVITVLDR